MAVKRVAIAIVALLLGAAAPARAWCEAACLDVPRAGESAKAHCPSNDTSSDVTVISAADNPECPVVEAARPVPAKIDLSSAGPAAAARPVVSQPTRVAVTTPRPLDSARFFERLVPLRI